MSRVLADILLVLPVALPLAFAAISLLFLQRVWVQRMLGVAGSAGLLVAGICLLALVLHEGIKSTALGGWPAPFGIVLVADTFSAVMVLLTGAMALLVAIYAWVDIDEGRVRHGFFAFYHILMMGVCGAFLTGDVFNLFVWFEVMLMASFVLLVLGGQREEIEGAVKYVALNLLSSILFLCAVGILYGKVGTLNMADLGVKVAVYPYPGLMTAIGLMFFTAFGIKAGIFPLFFWLPAAYHTPPVSVTTIFSALLTKVGIYAMVRMFTLVFQHDTETMRAVLLWIAALTMVTGVLGAVAQYDLRRLLSFHIISQIGYLLLGLGLAIGAVATDSAVLALASVLYFTVHVALAKSALFLVSGIAARLRDTYDLKQLGGLYVGFPGLAVLFLLAALALAGLPPFSGFFAKLGLVLAALRMGEYVLVVAALVVSLLTLYSMVKIWAEAFWKSPPTTPAAPAPWAPGERAAMYGPVVVLATLCIMMGVAAEPLFNISLRAAGELLDTSGYIQAVLGATP